MKCFERQYTSGNLRHDEGVEIAAGGGSGDQCHKGGDPEERHDDCGCY